MSTIKVTEQEVQLLEMFRRVDERGKVSILQAAYQVSDAQSVRDALEALMPEVKILREMFGKNEQLSVTAEP